MKLIVLGKPRTGMKSFTQLAEDQSGYNITCTDKAGKVYFNNLTSIEWVFQGKQFYIAPKSFKDHFDFTRYAQVVIKKVEEESFTSTLNELNKLPT